MRIKLITTDPSVRMDLERRLSQIAGGGLGRGSALALAASRTGPLAVGTPYDGMLSELAALDAGVTAGDDSYDALVLDDPGDPAIDALRSRLAIPVVGPVLASVWLGRLVGMPLGIVTARRRARSVQRALVLGSVSERVAFVSAFDAEPSWPTDLLDRSVMAAADVAIDRGAAAIALAGWEADRFVDGVARRAQVPVFGSTLAAVKLAEVLAGIGIRQSPAAYAPPGAIQDDLLRDRLAPDQGLAPEAIHADGGSATVSRRVLVVVPHSDMDEAAIGRRAKVIAPGLLAPGTEVTYTGLRSSPNRADSPYAATLMDVFCFERGLTAADEGFDALTVDSTTDSGIAGLRSRLPILVLGTGSATWALAASISHSFSIIAMEKEWAYFYGKNLKLARLHDHLVSVEAVGTPTDPFRLFEGKEAEMFARLEALGRTAIEDKGAEAIIIGSTTMHEAAEHLTASLTVPVLNPGRIALRTIDALLDLGLMQSRVESPTPEATRDEVFA
jgi:allantoin racemase